MEKRVTKKYLLGTFLITYIMWGSIIVANQFGYLKYGTPLSLILFAIGGNAPPIVAYMVLKKEHIIGGFNQFVKEAFKIKERPRFYLVLIIFSGLYFGVPALMQGISKGSELYIGFLTIPLMILLGGLEELGWRYILQPSLERHFSFGISTLLTAAIWSVWHLPLFFIAGTSQSNLNFGLFTIMVLGVSFALATIYSVSKNIWLCILFHSMINAFSSTWLIEENIKIKSLTTLAIMVLSFIIINYHNKKHIHKRAENNAIL